MTTKACKKSHRKHTPFTSGSQTTSGKIAYAAKKGKFPVSKLRKASKKMYENMDIAELKRHIKEAKGKKLPKKSKKSKKR